MVFQSSPTPGTSETIKKHPEEQAKGTTAGRKSVSTRPCGIFRPRETIRRIQHSQDKEPALRERINEAAEFRDSHSLAPHILSMRRFDLRPIPEKAGMPNSQKLHFLTDKSSDVQRS